MDYGMKIFFDNGYGVSIVRNDLFNPGTDDLWEIAVLQGTREDYKLLHDNVYRNLTDEQVELAVKAVQGEEVR
jgi:hypothetical protein